MHAQSKLVNLKGAEKLADQNVRGRIIVKRGGVRAWVGFF